MKTDIRNCSFKKFISNIDFYTDLLINEKVLHFKNINLSIEEQKQVSLELNKRMGYLPVNQDDFHIMYEESHNHLVDSVKNSSKKILVKWHLEHAESDNPQTLAVWNMITKKSAPSSGRTGFVDSDQILKKLSDKQIRFLEKSEIIYSNKLNKNQDFFIDEKGITNKFFSSSAFQNHPSSGARTLRIDVLNPQVLFRFEGRSPSLSESKYFKKLHSKIVRNVVNNRRNQTWISWEQGDLVIVDLFNVYHGVKGGFGRDERIFVGFWSFAK